MAEGKQRATERVEIRMTPEEFALLQEVQSLLQERVNKRHAQGPSKKLADDDAMTLADEVTQRVAIVESLRRYLVRLRDLKRSR